MKITDFQFKINIENYFQTLITIAISCDKSQREYCIIGKTAKIWNKGFKKLYVLVKTLI